MKLFKKIGKVLDKIFFGEEVETLEQFESRLEQSFGPLLYWDFDHDLYFEGDLQKRIYTQCDNPDPNKPNVYIRTTKDVTYFISEEHPPATFTEDELDKINLVAITAYWTGNGN